jgi:hypothetical protein
MPETLTLTSAITKPSTTTFQIERVIIDVKTQYIHVTWLGNNGEPGSAAYPTPAPASNPTQPTGAVLLNQLNNANLSTKSLVKRVIERLQTDGYLGAGAVSGTPD